MHFVNLTNGIEVAPYLKSFSFIRIQSTACEQKRWDFIIEDLDHNFLMSLALGLECVVYDYSAKKKIPRALFQGLVFIEFTLNKRWHGLDYIPIVRGNNVLKYFNHVYHRLSKRSLKKLDYYKKFLRGDKINLTFFSCKTKHDSDYVFYNKILNYLL